ncbi:MAG: riboflavin biosynthesis protein [Deltaproteobacteria bacterium]|jgi:riboflavin kinase/FMN adenylyltransferase|nr:MAG: riboflavin biosynthesis protein [Deltaproteobacteria bacterium]
MKIIFDPTEPIGFLTSATIGIFDGVHLGHKKIINYVKEEAMRKGISPCVITFHPHPQKVLRGIDIPLIVPFRERLRLLEKEGIEITVCYNFTREFAQISAKDFVTNILVKTIGIKSLFVGPDFFFGRKREGNVNLLEQMGKLYDFDIKVVQPVSINGEVVSSTAIRSSIEEGLMRKCAKFLGYHFYIEGKVKEGEKRGRKIGFPTANLDTDWELFPKKGVYATLAHVEGKRFESITNVGIRPTFNANQLLIETHIFDFNGDIYGKQIKIEFIERLRDERKFESASALAAQIAKDVEKAKEVLSELSE